MWNPPSYCFVADYRLATLATSMMSHPFAKPIRRTFSNSLSYDDRTETWRSGMITGSFVVLAHLQPYHKVSVLSLSGRRVAHHKRLANQLAKYELQWQSTDTKDFFHSLLSNQTFKMRRDTWPQYVPDGRGGRAGGNMAWVARLLLSCLSLLAFRITMWVNNGMIGRTDADGGQPGRRVHGFPELSQH